MQLVITTNSNRLIRKDFFKSRKEKNKNKAEKKNFPSCLQSIQIIKMFDVASITVKSCKRKNIPNRYVILKSRSLVRTGVIKISWTPLVEIIVSKKSHWEILKNNDFNNRRHFNHRFVYNIFLSDTVQILSKPDDVLPDVSLWYEITTTRAEACCFYFCLSKKVILML